MYAVVNRIGCTFADSFLFCVDSAKPNDGLYCFRAICDVFVSDDDVLPPLPTSGVLQDRVEYFRTLGMWYMYPLGEFC